MKTALFIFTVLFIFVWFFIRPLSVLIAGLIERKRKIKKDFSKIKEIEGVSILVPCHNEENTIEDTIKSLIQQVLPCKKEIIVIENNSTDNTWKVLKELEKKYYGILKPLSFKTPENEYPISSALNFGIEHCSYPYVFRIDADTILKNKKTIQIAIEPIVNGRAITVASNVRIMNDKQNILTRLQSMEYFISMEMDRRSQQLYKSVLCCSGAMQAFKLETLKKIGGYNTAPQIPEDLEITWRLHKEGNIEMNHKSVGYTDAPSKLKELAKQRIHWMKLGIICILIHKKGIFNKKYGIFGIIGLPLKVFMTVRSLIGIFVKIALSYEIATNTSQFIHTFIYITIIHFILYLCSMYIVAPVAYEKQGINQWFLIPLFVLIYQPYLVILRIIAVFSALKIIIKDYMGEKRIKASIEVLNKKSA